MKTHTPSRERWSSSGLPSSGSRVFVAVRVLPTQALQSRRVSPSIDDSRRARITSPPTEPPVLILWLNQETREFCGEPLQTPRANFGVIRYPALAPVDNFVLLFLPPCNPHLIPFGQVYQADPTCLSTPRRPCKAKTFRARSSPAPMQIKPQPAPAIIG
jgi:hypothetical protein